MNVSVIHIQSENEWQRLCALDLHPHTLVRHQLALIQPVYFVSHVVHVRGALA